MPFFVVTLARLGETFQKRFVVNVMIRGIGVNNKSTLLMSDTNAGLNKSRELSCSSQVCREFTVLHLGFLDYPHYVVTVRFHGLEPTHEHYNITDVRFYFKFYNPAFTRIEIWFRFVFLVITFIVTCWFGHSLRRFYVRDWSIEQKWLAILLPLLLLYNDPLFSITFLVNSWVPGMLDAMFQATFLCALLLFWLCIYHGIRQTKRSFLAFYAPKLIVVGMLWLSAFTLASWQKFNELRDPTYNYELDISNFVGFKVFFFIIGGLYLLYLIYLIIRAYAELRSMPYFDLRLKFLTTLMLLVLSVTVAITFLRFGAGVLQDNFVAELSTNYKNSAEFMMSYALLNFYMYTMAYVYSPAKNAVYESHFKDDPTFSMLNDSDDDVIYGEQEEGLLAGQNQLKRIDSDEDE
ncbi:PREDICTED: transmembrane protein 181-like [Priapulus caudatus]|uniref:Transmembrane protein 181-like n=1 Tax=Priapulus caudatus TaxID=37621 RepID=A0ABM1EDJ5_PRICU|nr:PREDICTED: transmembrane protein 181-like [Priapulus caudatus]